MTPAEASIRSYTLDAARFRLTAFALIEDGREAEGALAYARICERAAEAEEADPDPGTGAECICWACRWHRISVGLS